MANVNANVDTVEINAMSVLMHSTHQALSFQSVKAYQVRYFLLSKKSNQRIGSKKSSQKYMEECPKSQIMSQIVSYVFISYNCLESSIALNLANSTNEAF